MRSRIQQTVAAAALIASVALPTTVLAEPSFARAWKNQYGYTPSCNACHKDGGGTPVNSFGEQYKDAGMTVASFAAITSLDGDGDGATNGEEIQAKSNPGDKKSTPGDAGNWLDINNLIPQDVQALFEDATAYKPIDAIFTDAEISRAASMGVTLAEADETTIYVAVKDKRPIGTAIIVPGEFEGKQYFVLLATDRQLNVTHASALEAGSQDAAEDPALFSSAIGRNIAALENEDGESLAAQVAVTIKKAGTMLLVRLKPA